MKRTDAAVGMRAQFCNQPPDEAHCDTKTDYRDWLARLLGKRKMMQRRGKPSFTKEEERLLAYMDVTRHLTVNYAAAYGYHSPRHALSTSLTGAIDKLAEQITGDPRFFSLSGLSAGGQSPDQIGARARQERELRWRELRRKY